MRQAHGTYTIPYPASGPPVSLDLYQSEELVIKLRELGDLINEVTGSNAPIYNPDGTGAPWCFTIYMNGNDEVGGVQLLIRGEGEGGDVHESATTAFSNNP